MAGKRVQRLSGCLALLFAPCAPAQVTAPPDPPPALTAGARAAPSMLPITLSPAADRGRALYVDGRLPGGQPVRARRADGSALGGAETACVHCHRASGLGSFEGAVRVPPVAWKLLARAGASLAGDASVPHPLGLPEQRPAYTLATLQRALVDGVAADGHALSWVMPRYTLDRAQVEGLQAYLATLAARPPAGVQDGQLVFGFVVTPAADPQRTDALVALLEHSFATHNRSLSGGTGHLAMPAGSAAGGVRTWRLQVFHLQRGSIDWGTQLGLQLAQHPVFALLGGTGPGDWTPIDRFCAQRGLPLLFPAIEAPPAVPSGQALYFHRGVAAEAQRIAAFLLSEAPAQRAPVWQVARAEDSGAVGARALGQALAGQVVVQTDWLHGPGGVPAGPPLEPPDCVLWLRPLDLAPWLAAGVCRRIFLSGVLLPDLPDPLAGLSVPAGLAGRLWLTYPWELPARRRLAMNFPAGWLRQQGLAWRDPRAQTDIWLAAQILEAALADMQDAYFPDYLLERVESLVGHRQANAHYPHLTLAPGQQFASKGSYLLRWTGGDWQADDGWVAP